MTIEERAKEYAEQEISGFPDGSIWAKGDVMIEMQMSYEDGATEQKKIDVEKACEVYADLLSAQGYNPIDVNAEVVRMKKAMEE